MPLDFPNSPTNGQTYTGPNNATWQWDGTKWVAGYGASSAYAPVVSPVFTGDPQAPTPASGDADASIATTAFVAPSWNNAGRNLVHNSMFNVWQRGFTFTANPTTGRYTADRWAVSPNSGDSITVSRNTPSAQNVTDIGDENCASLLGLTVTGTSGGFTQLTQKIEAVKRLAGKTVTISFWANSSASLKIGINLLVQYGTGGSPSADIWVLSTGIAVTTAAGATFQRFSATVSIPSAAGKTLGTNGDDSTILSLWLSSGAATASLAGNIGVQSGVFNIWGVQLEVGSVATPLERVDPVDDLRRCQRFYQGADNVAMQAYSAAGQWMAQTLRLATPMRAAPTITLSGMTYTNASDAGTANVTSTGFLIYAPATATGQAFFIGNFTASADL